MKILTKVLNKDTPDFKKQKDWCLLLFMYTLDSIK